MRIIKELNRNTNDTVRLYVDEKAVNDIENLLNEDRKHEETFQRSINAVLEGNFTKSTYEYYQEYKISALKFKGRNTNPRIYCKEYFDEVKKCKAIVLIEPFRHKGQDEINKKIRQRFDVIKHYEYEIPF